MNKYFKYIVCAAVALLMGMGLNSCVKDLDVDPIDPALQNDVTPEQLFNKCYSVFATSGNDGGDSNVDVAGLMVVSSTSSARCGTLTSSLPTRQYAVGVTRVLHPIATIVILQATPCCVVTTMDCALASPSVTITLRNLPTMMLL